MPGPNFTYGSVARGALQNLDTGELRRFLINPEELTYAISVNYAQQMPIAGSRQRLQYMGTNNATWPLTLRYDKYVHLAASRGGSLSSEAERQKLDEEFIDHEKFLLAFCYPGGPANDPLWRSPPTGLLLWPGEVAIQIVIRSFSAARKRFDKRLKVSYLEIKMQWEEARTWRLTSAAARREGQMSLRDVSQKLGFS